jgi:hypothetical protein
MNRHQKQVRAHLQHTLPQHPIAAEMAAFEWALNLAFDAEHALILSSQDLAVIPLKNWAALKFRFHPSLYEAPTVIDITDESCLIRRQCLNLKFRVELSFSLIRCDRICRYSIGNSGGSFGLIFEKLHENASEEVTTLQTAQYLSSWLNEGLISATYS